MGRAYVEGSQILQKLVKIGLGVSVRVATRSMVAVKEKKVKRVEKKGKKRLKKKQLG